MRINGEVLSSYDISEEVWRIFFEIGLLATVKVCNILVVAGI